MRINGPGGAAATSPSAATRRAGGATFSIADQPTTTKTAQSSTLLAVSSVDALIVLQGVEDPLERRKRAVQRGRNALDVLDSVKLGLLDGDLGPATIGRLKSVVDGLKQSSGDYGLDAVLAEIELRVEVELAKTAVG
jgi:hypothetical protein